MRSLWNALVERSVGNIPNYTEFMQDSGHTAVYSVPVANPSRDILTSPTQQVYDTRNHIRTLIGEVRSSGVIVELFDGHSRGVRRVHQWEFHHYDTGTVEDGWVSAASATHWLKHCERMYNK